MQTRAPWMERPTLLGQAAKALLLTAIGAVMVLPFVYIVAVSFSSYQDVLRGGVVLFPANPTLEAYATVLGSGIVTRALLVSAALTIGGTALNMALTVTLAYALSRPGVPGSRVMLAMVLFTFLFTPGIIPNYLLVKELGLLNSYASLVLPGAINAFNLIVLRNFFLAIPQELIESAQIDGSGDLRLLWSIVLPLSGPSLAVITLFYGVAHWNEFFNATLYLSDSAMWPIQLVLRQYVLQGSALAAASDVEAGQFAPPQTIQMAVVVIATLPILLVYPFLQRYFTKGVLTGAVKG